MRPDINCSQFRALLSVVRDQYGPEGLATLLEGLLDTEEFLIADRFDPGVVSTVRVEHLQDPACWVSNEFSLRLLANVRGVVTVPNPLAWAGEQSLRRHLSRHTLFIARVVGPLVLCRQVARFNGRFNRTKTVQMLEARKGAARFKLAYRPGYRVTRDVCDWNIGMYIGVARVCGATHVSCRELRCVTEGAESCVLEMTWREPGLVSRLGRSILRRTAHELFEDYDQTVQDRETLTDSLRRSEERYRTLTESSLTGIYLEEDGRLTFANTRLAEVLGRPLAELLGKGLWELCDPEDRERVRRLAETAAEGPRADARFELRVRRPDGEPVWLEILSTRMEQQGGRAAMGNVIDTTASHRAAEERQRFEARLHQAQKMEAVGRLAGGVAHDFNNLLTCISGVASLMMQDQPAESPLREDLATILDATDRAVRLTRGLLAFSKRQALAPQRVDLRATIAGMEKILRRLLGEDVELEVHCPEVHPLFVDPAQIEQVLLNLVVNARDAMSSGGRLTLVVTNEVVDAAKAQGPDALSPGEYVRLRVSDTGTGIPPDKLPRIFEPFFTTKETGTGLGLATVHGIVKQSGGAVSVESACGVGTTFDIVLPRAPETAPRCREVTRTLADLTGSETVLVVEDNDQVRDLTRRILEALGYKVLTAKLAEEALRQAAESDQRFDLLLTDVVMPRMSGRDLAERLCRTRPGLKVLFMSGYADEQLLGDGRLDSLAALVRKPFSPSELASRVRETLGPREERGLTRGANLWTPGFGI